MLASHDSAGTFLETPLASLLPATPLPDLTPFGGQLPKNTVYSWRVFGYAPLTSLDDPRLADTLDSADGVLPPLNEVSVTASKIRTFTTAP